MAKRKRKKTKRPARPQTSPQPGGAVKTEETEQARPAPSRGAPTAVSNRQARKEQARRERERRIKRMRRQQRVRRLARWGITLGVVGAVVGTIVYVNTRPLVLDDAAAQAAAQRLGCGSIDEPTNEGGGHLVQNEPPDYANVPATSGKHDAAPYGGATEGPVIAEPVSPESAIEAKLVHNLEHAYVVIYYRAETLPEEVVSELGTLAESEAKVLLAQYTELPEGTDLAFTAWAKLLGCPSPEASEAEDVLRVARGFIDQYRGTRNAPEPQGA